MSRDSRLRCSVAAHYSLPHAAAAIVLRGEARLEAFDDAVVWDPAFARIRERVEVTENSALTARYPRHKDGRVTVTLTAGRSVAVARNGTRGDLRQPCAEAEIRAGFRALAGRLLDAGSVARVGKAVEAIKSWHAPDILFDLLRQSRAD